MSAITVAVNFLSKGLESVRSAGKRLLEDQSKSAEVTKKIQAGQIAVAAAYAYTSAKIMGYVRAGLAGTTMGERIATNFQFLNREIAQLFLPAIEKANRGLEKVVLWFRSLSGEQQKAIGKWAGLTVGMLGLLTVGPKIIKMFTTIGSVMKASIASNPLLMLIGGLGLLYTKSEKFRDIVSAVGKVLLGVFGGPVAAIGNALAPVFETLGEVGKGIGKSLMEVFRTLAPVIAKVGEVFLSSFGLVAKVVAQLIEAMSPLITALLPIIGKLAESMLAVFTKVADIAVGVLVPVLDVLVDILSGTTTKWITFGAVVLMMVPKIVTAVKLLTAAFTTMKGAMFFGIPLILGLFSSMSGGSKETKNHLADINDLLAGVRKGTITTEEAKKTAKERGGDKASQAELELAQKLVDLIASTKGIKDVSLEEALKILREDKLDEIMSNMTGLEKLAGGGNIVNMRGVVEDFSKLNKEQTDATKQQEAAIDAAAKKGKGTAGRSELIKSGGQFEDPRETFKRLQSASLKTDIPQRQLTTLEEIRDSINPLAGLMAKMAEKPTGAAE